MNKKIKTMDVVLVIIAIFLLLFVGLMILLYYKTGGIPDTLCTCVFACCGGECGIMGWIQTTKTKISDRENYLSDRKHDEEREQMQLKAEEMEVTHE